MLSKASICAAATVICVVATASDFDSEFDPLELSVAKFWEDMGPTLTERGLDAYAERYHEDFRHWDIQGSGRIGNKDSAIRAWSRFHEEGHRITCTHVEPVTIDIVGDIAIARLLYEQSDTLADGSTRTGVWRMVDVFKRYGDTWQVLESNMVKLAPGEGQDDQVTYEFRCPKS